MVVCEKIVAVVVEPLSSELHPTTVVVMQRMTTVVRKMVEVSERKYMAIELFYYCCLNEHSLV